MGDPSRHKGTISMRLLVMGAGAMGSAVGGFMAKAGHEVTLVGLDYRHMEHIAEHGLRITGIWGEHQISNLTARTDTARLSAGDFDLILITVKSYHTREAVEEAVPLVSDDTLVCSYQNGLGNAELIADAVGWERTVGARVIFGVRQNEPGSIEITVIANPTALGVYDPAAPADRVKDIAAAMDNAGIPTVYTDEIATVLWGKIAYNSALNPLSALLDVPYGALPESEDSRVIMCEVIHELYAVAEAMDVRLKPESPEGYLDLLFNELIPPTAAHYASMREDFVHGRRTEIDALNGAICRYGEQHNVACPTNTMLTRLVRARERAAGARQDSPAASS
jgi:2-dehydropantoate 2-reductase